MVACEEFVTIDPPRDQVVADVVFNDAGHANAALTAIYTGMAFNGELSYHIPLLSGLSADELTNHTQDGPIKLMYQNNLQPLSAPTNIFWNNGYNFIFHANVVWEGCERSTQLNEVIKKQLQAEARFIRAFWYFYLVNFYGDVPLLTTTDYRINALAPRSPVSEVYSQIIADLEFATTNLNPWYVYATGINTYDQRLRPNQSTANALLARTYLFTKEWQKAAQMASSVIGQTSLYDTVSMQEVFLRNNREAIWQLPNILSNAGTPEAQRFILTGRPSGSGVNNCTTLAPQLLAAFEDGDLRRENWIGTFVDGSITPNETYYFPYKYKDRNTTNHFEYTTPFRLAEQYLIRAEAFAKSGEMEQALADLNLVRKRAGLAPLPMMSLDNFNETLLHERQVELFSEWGHRWLDLKRTGMVDEVMQLVTPLKDDGIWNSDKQLWPIPQRELESNINLWQNTGYN